MILDPVVAAPQTATVPQLEANVWETQLPSLAQGLKWSGLGGRPPVVSPVGKGMPVQWSLVQGQEAKAVLQDQVVAVPQTAMAPQLKAWEKQLTPLAQRLKWSGPEGRPPLASQWRLEPLLWRGLVSWLLAPQWWSMAPRWWLAPLLWLGSQCCELALQWWCVAPLLWLGHHWWLLAPAG